MLAHPVPAAPPVRPVAETRPLHALTSLRFFAALAILVFHVPYVLPRSVGLTLLPQGSLGVSFFFMLSGFILRHVYAAHEAKPGMAAGSFDLRTFYHRRAARILPLYYACFLIWTWLFFDGWGNALGDKVNSGIAHLLLIHAFFSGPLYNLGYNAVDWSISVEMFFYALFPFLLRQRRDLLVFALYVLVFLLLPAAAATTLDQAMPNFFYFNPVARLLEFSAGMVAHRLWQGLRPGRAVATLAQVAGIVLLLVLVPATQALPSHLRNLAMLLPFGLLIMAFAWPGLLERALSRPFLVLLGEASFALYMTHHMLFQLLDPLLAGRLGRRGSLAVATIAAVLLSIALYRLFERPMRQLLSKPRRIAA